MIASNHDEQQPRTLSQSPEKRLAGKIVTLKKGMSVAWNKTQRFPAGFTSGLTIATSQHNDFWIPQYEPLTSIDYTNNYRHQIGALSPGVYISFPKAIRFQHVLDMQLLYALGCAWVTL